MTALSARTDPPELHYLIEQQVWARVHDDGTASVGITRLGIRLSGELYMCRPKRVGTDLRQGDSMAVVELSKSIVSVKSPVSGRVVEINETLEDDPGQVHRDPYGTGWIARIALSDFDSDRSALVHGDEVDSAMREHAWLNRAELLPDPSAAGTAPESDA